MLERNGEIEMWMEEGEEEEEVMMLASGSKAPINIQNATHL